MLETLDNIAYSFIKEEQMLEEFYEDAKRSHINNKLLINFDSLTDYTLNTEFDFGEPKFKDNNTIIVHKDKKVNKNNSVF